METNIYLDVYFVFNFLMDFFVLLITGIIIRKKLIGLRLVAGSAIGAIYAVIVLITEVNVIIQMILTYIFISEIMILVTFGKTSMKLNLQNLLYLYLVTFLTDGLINALYYGTYTGKTIIEKANINTFGSISFNVILFIVIVISAIAQAVIKSVKKQLVRANNIFCAKIRIGNKKVEAVALRDTGNSLYEPISGKPVSVIEKDVLKPFESEAIKVVIIPYNTVGKNHGIMYGFVAESMEIEGRTIEKPIIGIHKGKLSGDKRYNMILHPNILE